MPLAGAGSSSATHYLLRVGTQIHKHITDRQTSYFTLLYTYACLTNTYTSGTEYSVSHKRALASSWSIAPYIYIAICVDLCYAACGRVCACARVLLLDTSSSGLAFKHLHPQHITYMSTLFTRKHLGYRLLIHNFGLEKNTEATLAPPAAGTAIPRRSHHIPSAL